MFTIFYKSYPCAPGATLCSALCSGGTYLCILAGIMMGYAFFADTTVLYHELWALLVAIALFALAAFLYFFVYKKAIPAMAEKQTQKNIRTKADAAYLYCQSHPQAYAELRAVNPAFARKYELNETGKIVRTKR